MRHLFSFLFLLLSCNVFAQYPAASDRLYFTQSKTEWQEVADWTNGIINDSIFGIEFNGKKYQRIDLNTTSFNAQSLMIRADGTDMSPRLNRLFNNARINEIVIDQVAGGDISIGDDVDLRGKTLRYTGFTKIKRIGGGNPVIKNGIIAGPSYSQIADTAIRFENINPDGGYFYVNWYGAKGDEVNDDTKAIQSAFNVKKVTVKFARGNYLTSDSLSLSPYNSIEMLPGAEIIADVDENKHGIMAGSYNPGERNIIAGNSYSIRISRKKQSNWSDTLSVGIKLVNLNHNEVHYLSSKNFCVGIETVGYNSGFSYVDFDYVFSNKNKMHFKISTQSPSSLAWNNQNNYRGGWFHNGSENMGVRTFGFVVGNGSYAVTNNIATGFDIEMQRSNAIPIHIRSGARNKFIDFRSEGNSDTTVLIDNNQFSNGENRIYAGRDGGSGFMVDLSNAGSNYYASADRLGINYSNFTTIAEVENAASLITYDSDSAVNIRYPGLFQTRSNPPFATNTLAKQSVPVGTEDYIYIDANNTLFGITTDYIDANFTKKFVLKQSVAPGSRYAGVYISLYNSNGENLGANVPFQCKFTPAYTATYGGAWAIGNVPTSDISMAVPDTAKFFRVTFGRPASGVSMWKGYKITSYAEGHSAQLSTVDRMPFRRTKGLPEVGSFNRGEIILNSAPADTAARGWICTRAGTFGTLTGVTGSISNGQTRLILNAGSGVKLKRWEWLSLNGNPAQIFAIDGDTAFINRSHTGGALSGATINYSAPIFISLSGGSAIGGVGDGNHGEITVNAGDWTVNNNAITYAKIQQAAGLSVIGRSTNSIGNIAAIHAATAGDIFYRNGTSLEFGKPDLGTSITTSLSGYIKAAAGGFSATATVPYQDISGVPDLFFKNSSNSGDTLLYKNGDTLKVKRIEVIGNNSLSIVKTIVNDKVSYNVSLAGDASTPGSNKIYGTNASGVKGWYDAPSSGPGGGVSSVGLSLGSAGDDANVSGSPITNSGTIILNLPSASSTNRGLLTAANWTTFNNKANGSTTITINGTAYNLSANRSWNVGTVTSVGLSVGSSGTDVNVSGTPVSVAGMLNINIPTASATARGVLSTADWIAFNAKASPTTIFSAGSGLIGGGTLSANRSFALGTPSDITSSSVNSASGTTHTHALNNTGVAPGTYTNATVTVDAKGRITFASNGQAVPIISEGEYVPEFVFSLPQYGYNPTPDSVMISGEWNRSSPPMASILEKNPLATVSYCDTFYYTRDRDKVHVWGRMVVSTTQDGFETQVIGISLPSGLGSYFTSQGQMTGTGYARKVGFSETKIVTVNNSINAGDFGYPSIQWLKGTSGGQYEVGVSFDYIIKDQYQ